MRNPRISISDDLWAQARARAAGTNTTVSTVVESALSTYLANRGSGMTQGSVIPEFKGAIEDKDLAAGNIEVPIHGVEVKKDPVTGYREVRPAPKPVKKGRQRYDGDSW